MTTVLWLVLAAGFLVLELSTVALVSIWFSAGALIAAGVSALHGPVWLQIAAFVASAAGLVLLLRPLVFRKERTRTNVDSVIGTQGRVTADIDNIAASGQVRLGTMTWTARSTDGAPIAAGTLVRADRIEGVKVFVSPVPEKEAV